MEEYLTLVSQYGFPIFVAIYFMIRMEKILAQNTVVMTQIKEIIEKCQKP